jgi:nitrous oxidase accessory protein NosD
MPAVLERDTFHRATVASYPRAKEVRIHSGDSIMTGRSLRRSVSFLALLLAAAPLHAGTIKVPKDQPTIQDGVNAAVAGDIVSVSKGTYNENVVITTNGITLKGSSATISGRYLGACITVTANDVTIQSFTLLNGAEGVLDGEPLGGGLMATGSDITVTSLTVAACSGSGIRLIGTGSIQSCKVDGCIERGISVTTPDASSTTITVVSKNTVTHCDNGITLDNGPFTVQSNTCSGNLNEGIECDLGNNVGTVTTISKNKCNSNLGAGIIVSCGTDPTVNADVSKNTMDANDTGCVLEGFNIDATSNTITDSVEDGFVMAAQLCNVDKNTIKNNGGIGLRITGGNSNFSKDTVLNGTFGGIKITGNTNLLDSMTVKDCEGDGIEIELGTLSTTLSKCTVTGNDHDGIDNSGTITIIANCTSKTNGGKDIAGAGDGAGLVNGGPSVGNKVSDDSDIVGFTTLGVLDLL